jgi:hypothetical protein
LNPSGGARNRPRNKFVLAQKKNELNKDFAPRGKFALRFSKKIKDLISAFQPQNFRFLPPDAGFWMQDAQFWLKPET